MVYASRWISFHLQASWLESPLFTDENIEIVVYGMEPSVPFGAQRRSENEYVLCNTGVDDIHSAHSTASIVEDPFGFVGVDPR